MINDQPLTVVIDGRTIPLGLDSAEPLVRAVVISLFTWRRANPDDDLPGDLRQGWWGDGFPAVPNDKIGSRLWLLSRAKLTSETVVRAREYAEETLAWLVKDGVAIRVVVEAERQGICTLAGDATHDAGVHLGIGATQHIVGGKARKHVIADALDNIGKRRAAKHSGTPTHR